MKFYSRYVVLTLLLSGLIGCDKTSEDQYKDHLNGPTAKEILGNPNYPAISYGGYREKTRDDVPTVEDLKEDMQILFAMGVRILRTYNASQFPQAERILEAIKQYIIDSK